VEPADAAPSPASAGANPAGFAVVGIGASAGGLDAFKRFLTVMPADADMAFVLVQHLDPTHESLTAELLARHTAMPVVQVVDEMQVEPNHIYVIPPNAYLTISGRTLHLTAPAERHGIRMAIDFFFRSLADDQQERAIGIILTGSGTDGTFVRRVVPYRTEDDRIDGVVITFTDITKRRADDYAVKTLAGQLQQRVAQTEAANAALRESEARFRNLLEWTPDAVVVADDQGQIIQVNQRLEAMFGYGREELLGQPVERLIPLEVGQQHITHRARFFASPRAQVAGVERQVTGTRKNGSEFPAEIHVCSLEIQGRRLAMASVRDVTERKKAEEARARLAAIMQNTSTAIVVLASDGTILNWNHGAERLFGYAEQEAAGQNIKLLLPLERAGEFQQVAAQLRQGGPVEDFETVHRHKDGTSIDVALTVSLVEGEGSCWVARDMRERKRLEQQLAELADDERQRLGRELHDTLGQQFTAIAMMASTLRLQVAATSPQNEVLAKMEANIEEAKRQLRSISKGLLPVEVDAHGLTVALEELAEQVRQIHRVECRFESPEPVPLHDNFTATQLYLIAREAVHNALQHARAGSIAIQLRDHEGISLAIRDDGVGIRSQAESETGMGIRIMRHRCGLIGGVFQVLSPAEGGTVVRCVLPVGVDDEACQ
jgi:PAS domain S-box-containing protein